MKLRILFCATVAALVVLGGCATTRQARKVETSGFLSDYSMLKPGEDGQALLVYRNPNADFSKYDKVLLDGVTAWGSKDSKLGEVDQADLRRLVIDLHFAIQQKLAEDYTIVDVPGPGTLHIRTALTEAGKSVVALDIFSTIAPPARILSAGKTMATGTAAFVGEASAEIEVRDGATGEVLIAAVDKRSGGKSLKGSTDPWSDVHFAFAYWAQRIKDRLAEERAKN